MSFKEIFCQDKAIEILHRSFISGRSAHAYIFAGADGVGKYTTARRWAKLLLCENPVIEKDSAESCGKCNCCKLFEADSHPEFNHIYKELRQYTEDGAGKAPPVDLPIDVIREFLLAKVSIRPSFSQRKVFIVSEAEKLNASSQNALLKVLEEPPAYCCIILVCSRLDKLLATIKSRSQIIRFGAIDRKRIIGKLAEIGLDEKRAAYFAGLSQGSLGQACQWAKLELSEANLFQTRNDIVQSLINYDYAGTLDFAQELVERSKKIASVWSELEKDTSKSDINRRATATIIRMLIAVFQDIMTLEIRALDEAINLDQLELIKKLAGRYDSETSANVIKNCYEKLRWIEANVNERLIFEHLLFELADSGKIQVSL